jgi:hypothetical protein
MAFHQQPPDHLPALVPSQLFPHPLLQGVIVGDGEGHQFLKGHLALAINIHQDRTDRAQAQALSHYRGRRAETRGDILGAQTLLDVEALASEPKALTGQLQMERSQKGNLRDVSPPYA